MSEAVPHGGRTDASVPGFAAIRESPRGRHYDAAKRVIDVSLSSLLLVVSFPILALIAAAVKIDSPGPVLFVQERVGTRRVRRRDEVRWELRKFGVVKFRSMHREADDTVHREHIASVTKGAVDHRRTIKLANDDRVTRVGRVLRKTSLDELPQLLNVLRGEMSLVGPRPVPLYEFERYRSAYAARFAALPGISGLWQVRGRCALPFGQMIACDLEYVARPSIRRDLAIMLRTVPAVISAKGAG